jgi:hypothetical protein
MSEGDSNKLTTEQLVENKLRIDEKLGQLKIREQQVRSTASRTGLYIEPDEYAGLCKRIRILGAKSQAIQVELGKRKKAQKMANVKKYESVAHYFVITARRVLSEEDFAWIMQEAEIMHRDQCDE